MKNQVYSSLVFIMLLFVRHGHVECVQVVLGDDCLPERNNSTKERIITVQALEQLSQYTKNVCSLQISNSNISYLQSGIFVNFTGLLRLSFYNNNIQKISAKAFQGLTALRFLNLSMNPIKDWNTSMLMSHVPNLTSLDLTGTSPWLPDDGLLQLRHLKSIEGLSWGQDCWHCSIIKSTNLSQLSTFARGSTTYSKGYACRTETTSPTKLVQRFARRGFLATCLLEDPKCYQSEIKVVVKAPCRETTLSVLYLQYFLGPVAILFNLAVIVTTIFSKRLRQNFDMLLVCNIGIGDLFNGVYSVLIISIHSLKTFDEMVIFAQNYCACVGFFWVMGTCLAVCFALVLTIERYKCVVRRRPCHSRMSPLVLVLASTACWLWALTVAVLPIFGIGSYSLNTYCISVFPVKSNPVQFYYSTVVAGLSGILYLATVPMYIKMYVFVRKSSKNMRVRADIELAKRVFLLVLTNVLFFLVPIIISLIFANVNRETKSISREASEVINVALPLICLTLNSVFNPSVYAFRSRLFRKELVRMLPSRLSFKWKITPKTCRTNVKLLHVRAAYIVHSNNSSLVLSD